jgi:hypothetical protein
MSEQGTAGKRKHITLTFPQKLESAENQREVMVSYNIGLSAIYDIRRVRTSCYHLWQQTLKEPKSALLDKAYKWFTTTCSKGKPVTGPVVIEKAKCSYDEMKITDKCTSSYGWLRSFKELRSVQALSCDQVCLIIQNLSRPV